MSKSNAFETDLLELIFNATALADLAENDTSSPATTISVALHTADPGETGDQDTSEATYTSYARVEVARSGAGWTVSGNSVTNAADIDFPTATGGSETITHFSVGYGAADAMLYYGALSSSVAVSSGIQVSIAAGDLTITED
jgi:predicted methyltransferase